MPEVYRLHNVLDRRLHEGAPLITCACIDLAGDRFYLGLENGFLEEYRIIQGDNDILSCSVSAKKRISKKLWIVQLLALPVPCAHLVAVLSDGSAFLVDSSTFDLKHLPKATAISAVCLLPSSAPCSEQSATIVLASKPSRKTVKLFVYRIPFRVSTRGGPGPSRALHILEDPLLCSIMSLSDIVPSVTSLAACLHVVPEEHHRLTQDPRPDDPIHEEREFSIILCCGLDYVLVPWKSISQALLTGEHPSSSRSRTQYIELFQVPEELAFCPPTVFNTSPHEVMVTMGAIGMCVDASGRPCGSTVPVGEESRPPKAFVYNTTLCCILALSEYELRIQSAADGALLQRISLLEEGAALHTGSRLHISIAEAERSPFLDSHKKADDDVRDNNMMVVIADSCVVSLCRPVPLAVQAQRACDRGDLEVALELVPKLGQREEADRLYTRVAWMYFDRGDVCRGIEVLEKCQGESFTLKNPVRLVALFPEYHEVLRPFLDAVFRVSDASHEDFEFYVHRTMKNPIKESEKARKAVLQYLFRMRTIVVSGASLQKMSDESANLLIRGIDTFLALLFIDDGAEEEMIAFASLVPNRCDGAIVGPRLEAVHWGQIHALLCTSQGQHDEALVLWEECLRGGAKKKKKRSYVCHRWMLDAACSSLLASIMGRGVSMGRADGGGAPSVRPTACEESEQLSVSWIFSPQHCHHLAWLFDVDAKQTLEDVIMKLPIDRRILVQLFTRHKDIFECCVPPGTEGRWRFLGFLLYHEGDLRFPFFVEEEEEERRRCDTEYTMELFNFCLASLSRNKGSLNTEDFIRVEVEEEIVKPEDWTWKEIFFSEEERRNTGRRGEGHVVGPTSPCHQTVHKTEAIHREAQCRLLRHMRLSHDYDCALMLEAIEGILDSFALINPEDTKDTFFSWLLVAVLTKKKAYRQALEKLVFDIEDLSAAQQYAQVTFPRAKNGNRELFQLLVHPPEAYETRHPLKSNWHSSLWRDACWLLLSHAQSRCYDDQYSYSYHEEDENRGSKRLSKASSGSSWNAVEGNGMDFSRDSLEIIKAVPDSVPLASIASDVVAPLVRESMQRRRHIQMTKALLASRLCSEMTQRASLHETKTVIDEDTVCSECHLRLGGRVFVLVPSSTGEGQQTRGAMCSACFQATKV